MEVYLDNSATTKPYDEVVKTMSDVMSSTYGNPSSLHRMGKQAEDSLTKSRETLAKSIGCQTGEFYFTSGGTESNNLAIIGYVAANKREGRRIITQPTEHAAVLEPFKYLETQGFEVCYVPVDSSGFPDIEKLKELINDETITRLNEIFKVLKSRDGPFVSLTITVLIILFSIPKCEVLYTIL